ncbi:uncharacterized membrane protein YjjP (DUF1212 family) [Weissella uvarum]|nr:threonine/serine exporter family protein [Weissella uvarum]MBM7617610.1 uncharacterized membrane protein YjjP (DUF1212 family) [Weissella uvarum]
MAVDQNKIIETCLLAGRIMVEGGSEIYRVEDTMRRIVRKASNNDSQIFATITGVLVTMDADENTRFSQINRRGIDMEKINIVNELSRKFTDGTIDLDQLRQRLKRLDRELPNFPLWLRVLGAGFEGMFLMIIFTQTHAWVDMPLTMLAAATGYLVSDRLGQISRIRFVQEFMGALALGLVGILGVRLGLGHNIDNVLIGAVMPLVPGVPITNALRDLIEGNLLAGIERGFEATLTVFAIACAIGTLLHYV